ncbi:MAG: 3',5'-cyclic-nucleotide phosphodiesterase [Acidobacteria bacterium]|nr:3',5'-cyclic-nucleotide phosphodiesterase [Acidobacteriota bacterium]
MKLQLLPSTFDENGRAAARQHLACFVVDDLIAFDAGSLALATTPEQKKQIRDVVISHAHLDHIAGLPLYIDDLFATIKRPIQIHATQAVIDVLERDIFNWSVYPRFSELRNENGVVMEYRPFETDREFPVKHLTVRAVDVNHKVPSVGFVVSDGKTVLAMTGDTAEMNGFWNAVNQEEKLSALLIECAFPNELGVLAGNSHHLTPRVLEKELKKFSGDCPVYVINIKPMYSDQVRRQIADLNIPGLDVLEIGKIYDF